MPPFSRCRGGSLLDGAFELPSSCSGSDVSSVVIIGDAPSPEDDEDKAEAEDAEEGGDG